MIYLSSCAMPLWMAIAGKFCSTSSWDRATQRCTDLTKITTWQRSKEERCIFTEKRLRADTASSSCSAEETKLFHYWARDQGCKSTFTILRWRTVPGWTRAHRAGQTAFGSSHCPSTCSNTAVTHGASAWSHHPQTLPLAVEQEETTWLTHMHRHTTL